MSQIVDARSRERLPLTSEAIYRLKDKSPYKLQIVHINHLLGDVIALNKLMESQFGPVHFVSLDYSREDTVDQATLSEIANVLSGDDGEYIVFEDGGYWTSLMMRETSLKPPIAHIEQTTKGARLASKAISSGRIKHPIYSIARSLPKLRVENFFIANRIVMETEILLSLLGETSIFRRCVVIGYGIIGRPVARALKQNGCDVYVYDEEESILNLAYREGFSSISHLNDSDASKLFVFGATGNDVSSSIYFDRIISFACETFLISCSSGEVEFSSWRSKNTSLRSIIPSVGESYIINDQKVTVLANGRPVNFFRAESESLPDCVADLINTTLVAAATTALSQNSDLPSLRLLDVDFFSRRGWDGLSIVEKWTSVHNFYEKSVMELSLGERGVHPFEGKLAHMQNLEVGLDEQKYPSMR